MTLSGTGRRAIHAYLSWPRWCAPPVWYAGNATPAALRQNPSSIRKGSSIQANLCIDEESPFALARQVHSVVSRRGSSTQRGSVLRAFLENHRNDRRRCVHAAADLDDRIPGSPTSNN